MEHLPIIRDLIIIFICSLPIIFLFRKLHLPSIVGFLAAGIIIGPHGLGFITNIEDIEAMAEMGVVLLLFTIGLEISLSRLQQMKRFLLAAGGLQVSLTMLLSILIFLTMNIGFAETVLFGMMISMSSTAIVLRLLSDKEELEAPHGRIALGILIFQDLAVVPMMMLLPVIGAGQGVSATDIVLKLLIAFGVLLAVFAAARLMMPRILYQLAKLKSREAFTIGVILLILSTAYLTYQVGLSLAIGAFIAGLILAESDYTHQVNAEIVPFKDAFNSLFFVSIGLLLDYNFIAEHFLLIIPLTTGILFLKGIIVFMVIMLLKYPSRTALISALSLAQIGEFSFVLAQSGMGLKLIPPLYYNAFIAASIFTMLLTPLLVEMAPWLAHKFKSGKHPSIPVDGSHPKPKDHVIIAGFGLSGRNLVRVLSETGIPYIITELNPDTVREFKGRGEKIIYGDVTKKDVLMEANAGDASIMVFAISDPGATRIGIKLAKELNSNIYCIVRTRYVSEIDEFLSLGADEVIPEEFETSLQIFSKVLERYHIPLNIIMRQSNIIRHESYGMLRRKEGIEHPLSHIDKILAEGLTETYFVEDVNSHIGMTLREINIRALTGATIIAISRSGSTLANPPGQEVLQAGDTLVIYGTHNAVDKAMQLLNKEKV